ncbi:MAG: Rid family detoxifying hydrolase [Planctomycetaceae bacterium]|nr:Rid family detoxifying hydrolase [Planctomycetaceae bacterium]
MLEKIDTSNAPRSIGPYTQAIKVNGLIFTSGQIPLHPVSNTVEATTIEGQTEQVIQNLKAVLEAAGSSLDQTVKTTCFLQKMSDFAAFNNVYAKHFTNKPARSCVAAKELPRNVLIEIDAVAVEG